MEFWNDAEISRIIRGILHNVHSNISFYEIKMGYCTDKLHIFMTTFRIWKIILQCSYASSMCTQIKDKRSKGSTLITILMGNKKVKYSREAFQWKEAISQC